MLKLGSLGFHCGQDFNICATSGKEPLYHFSITSKSGLFEVSIMKIIVLFAI